MYIYIHIHIYLLYIQVVHSNHIYFVVNQIDKVIKNNIFRPEMICYELQVASCEVGFFLVVSNPKLRFDGDILPNPRYITLFVKWNKQKERACLLNAFLWH